MGVGDHPAERMAQHELEEHFDKVREANRRDVVDQMIADAHRAAARARQ